MHYNLTFLPMEVICREGDTSTDLFQLLEGKLLVCTVQGTQVKAIARIHPGEFLGELSFFDGEPRASYVVALEKSVLTQITRSEVIERLPQWLVETGKNLTKKIRHLDEIVHASNIRRTDNEETRPLTVEDQRLILAAITN